ncbi:DUF3182 family protein [Novosphingobium aerophilum]|uniref:DUF3182 family protein n=1 Tax=Novosphingobium aerophilum TaxID=2839843 RepID=UPI00163D6715
MGADFSEANPAPDQHDNQHDWASRHEVARRLAGLCRGVSCQEHDRITCFDGEGQPRPYFIPSDTLLTTQAGELGIACEGDLYGGVVPFRFIATKAVGHPLVRGARAVPEGWNEGLGKALGETVLPGFSTFDLADALAAGTALLESGPVRIKPVEATAGRGQVVVRSPDELEAALSRLNPGQVRREGLVLEQNLVDVKTFSIGSSKIFDRSIAYWGTQAITVDRRGQTVYGGTRLHAVRGGLAELAARDFSHELAEAIEKARHYDRTIFEGFSGMFASRRNYDVASGRDHLGRSRIGVLEQSWRVGGATPAEITAFERFAADPQCDDVICATVEVHGDCDAAPPGAIVYYAGVDPVAGPMTKYVMVIE